MRFNSKLALGVLAISGLAGMAGVALGQNAPAVTPDTPTTPTAPHGWHRHHRPGMLGGGLMIALHQLNLTASQREQVHTILQTARSQAQANRSTASSDFLVLSNPGDPNYATALQSAEQRATARIQRASQLEQQIYAVLTPAQQQALPGVLANLQANRGKWHGNGAPTPPPAT
jgi:Spy/CpxP family protein refolding chaperone